MTFGGFDPGQAPDPGQDADQRQREAERERLLRSLGAGEREMDEVGDAGERPAGDLSEAPERRRRWPIWAAIGAVVAAWAAISFATGGEGIGLSFCVGSRCDSAGAREHYNRGLDLAASGELDAAIAEYDRAIELDLGLALAYNNAGSRTTTSDASKRPSQTSTAR